MMRVWMMKRWRRLQSPPPLNKGVAGAENELKISLEERGTARANLDRIMAELAEHRADVHRQKQDHDIPKQKHTQTNTRHKQTYNTNNKCWSQGQAE
eukprot:1025298-Pyramimonas_sp.AAC.3